MKVFLSIGGVLALAAGLTAGIFGHLQVMGAAICGFAGCLIAANLDRIAEFRASLALRNHC